MFELKVENTNGDIVTLTQNESKYQVINIEGLNPPNATLHLGEVSGMDGAMFASSKLETRNIVITLKLNGDVEANRRFLYRFFRTKHYCKVYFSNDALDVYTEGYMDTIENNLFELGQTMQVSIVCPDPYFQSIREIVDNISQVIGTFEFPFAFGAKWVDTPTITDDAIEFSTYLKDRITNVYNEGEDDTGLIIQITAMGEVINPTIYNVVSRQGFSVNITMRKNDVLTINTNRGNKSVTLMRDGVLTSQINKVDRGSTWFTLSAGDNQFTYEADTGAEEMDIIFTHRTRYEAV